jgi:ubiquinone/menaquinone biosynthesis C-methylase UbiE
LSDETSEQGRLLADVFNASGSHFDEVTPHVWGPAGVATVDALRLSPGERVLDVCSGTGASAIPAAVQVGPDGRVLAVDLASDLLELGRTTAERLGLSNIEFRQADATSLDAVGEFDALSCAFGVFFLPSMDSSVTALLSLLRPGGRFAFTVWHEDSLYEFTTAFFEAADEVDGKMSDVAVESQDEPEPHPITRIDSEDKITAWASSLGGVEVSTAVLQIGVLRSDSFSWNMVMGRGLRDRLLGRDDEHVAAVRARFLALLAERGITEIKCDSLTVAGRVRS